MNIQLSNVKKTQFSPQNLDEVVEKVKELAKEATPSSPVEIDVVLDDNRFNLSSPMVLSAEKNPELANVRLTLRGSPFKKPLISAQRYFYNDKFEAVEGKPYFKYQLPQNEDGSYPIFREMYVDGKRVPMAKSPMMIHVFPTPPEAERDEIYLGGMFLPEETVKALASEDMVGAELQFYLEWVHKIFRILDVDFSMTREQDGKTYVYVRMAEEYTDFAAHPTAYLTPKGRECAFWNARAFLTPGSFTYDYKTGVLYFYPAEGNDIVHHTHEYPILTQLMVFDGLEGLTLENLSFKGLTTVHASKNGYLCGQSGVVSGAISKSSLPEGNTIYNGRLTEAAVYTRNMRLFTVKNCAFTGLGGYGLLMLDRSVGVRIEDCRFEDIGMSAICIGNPKSALTTWEDPINQNINVVVTNNYIRHVGYEYPASCAFYISLVDVLEFTHNSVIDVPYSALSAGWNWRKVPFLAGEKVNVRDADISFNYFEDYMTLLHDGGATYVNGGNCRWGDGRMLNVIHDNYAVCHEMRSRARYGYYMDGAASHWDCYHNVVINANNPIFAQPHNVSTSLHVHCHDIYSNTPYRDGMFFTERDNLVWDYHDKAKTEEEMLAMYPAAVEIKKNAGVKKSVKA